MGSIPLSLESTTTEYTPPIATTAVTLVQPTATTTMTLVQPTGADLLVEVTATVVIHNFDKYYPGMPIGDFKPKYFPLVDGSLVCPPLIKDLLQVHAILIICSALFVFFFRNTFTVIRYIHSGKVPHKALFYVLLGSQAIGSAFPLPTLISTFTERVDCRTWVVNSPPTQSLNTEPRHS